MWFQPKSLSNLLIPDIYVFNGEVLCTVDKTKYTLVSLLIAMHMKMMT